MLSGSSATGCTENDCRVMRRTTLLDDFSSHSDGLEVAGAFSSWPKIETAATSLGRGIVSAGRFSGINQEALSRYPACEALLAESRANSSEVGSFRSDQTTAALARAFLQQANSPFVFISLGETDEAAHKNDYRGYLEALHQADHFVGQLREDLSRLQAQGRDTLLLVTTDHGRAEHFTDHGRKYPESSRSFLIAEGAMIRARGQWDSPKAYLRDIAPTVRALNGLPLGDGMGQGRVLREMFTEEVGRFLA